MKKLLKTIFILLLGFIFIMDVKADGTISLSLSCPTTANQNQKITCTIYGKIKGDSVTSLILEAGTKSGPIEYKEMDYETSASIGDNVRLGTLTAETLNDGTAVLYVKVKNAVFSDGSEYSGTTTNAYINVTKSGTNTLSSLKIDGTTIAGFHKNTTSYSLTTTKKSISVTALATSSKAQIEGTGTKSLTCGANVFTINVIAENGAVKNYTINVTRTCKTENNTETNTGSTTVPNQESTIKPAKSLELKDISISAGKLSPEFKANITEYEVKVDKDIEKITITGIKKESGQTITGNVSSKELAYGENKVNITVMNSSGEKRIYTVNIIREDNRDDNNYLSSISLSSGMINFDKEVTEYEVKVLNDIEKIEVLAVPEKSTSKVEVKKDDVLKDGENIIVVTVTSEKETTRSYTIKVIRLGKNDTLGNNPYIENIIIKNYNFKFDYSKEDYKLVIKNEDSIDIKVIMEDKTSTYQIIGNENLKDNSVITIKTFAPDGTEKEYTITITKASYTIYYLIFIALLVSAIALPVFVYFKLVKKKKQNLDVNGYVIGKEYEEKDYSRKVISDANYKQNFNNLVQNSSEKNIPNINNQVGQTSQNIVNIPTPYNNLEQPPVTNVTSQNDVIYENNIMQTPQSDIGYVNNVIQTPQENIIGSNIQNNGINNNASDEFDGDLNMYTPNADTKCPHCGRELLGHPDICPYCKNGLK